MAPLLGIELGFYIYELEPYIFTIGTCSPTDPGLIPEKGAMLREIYYFLRLLPKLFREVSRFPSLNLRCMEGLVQRRLYTVVYVIPVLMNEYHRSRRRSI